ncbi:hypothetical protein FRX31_023699 [Thalictrum thalictroides]|uniref:Uncharacterized protein n=1 Tax=Thalictrum thalictroides TaxID=46969 RepID=A0A7J6VR55_THATH|nr:hypothetical protein FRX31_023699 [Thalictrum thalictroides]
MRGALSLTITVMEVGTIGIINCPFNVLTSMVLSDQTEQSLSRSMVVSDQTEQSLSRSMVVSDQTEQSLSRNERESDLANLK